MARPKKQTRAKEPVRIRFKELSNGNKSIYLDIYRDGKRSYEFLKLYLVPEKSQVAKVQNEQVMAAANAIKSQRIIELSNNTAGIKVDPTKAKILLCDWLQICKEQKRKKFTAGTVNNMQALINNLAEYGDRIPMRNVDKDYCLGFIEYLRNYRVELKPDPKTGEQRPGKPLSAFTINARFELLTAVLNAAVREEIISVNPIKKIEKTDKTHRPESKRTFLTIDEIKTLIDTPAEKDHIKRAFLFSCFCGLRFSDVRQITWANIEENNGRYYANIIMQKTKEPLYLPLSQQALSFLPERKKGDSMHAPIFNNDIRLNCVVNKYLKRWADAAGITKTVTFHVARHTFATTSLTLGADLYTTSKLLGHTNISITQVYAKIVNEKKNEAVDLFDRVF